MNIEKSNDNFKDGKLKCFNYNKYKHWPKSIRRRKKKKQQNVSNVTEKDILPRIAKKNNQ